MNFRLGLSLVAALVLTACNDGGGEGDATASETGAGEPVTEVELDEFFALAEAAYCEWQVECRAYGVEERCRAVNHFEDRLSMRRLSGVGSSESIPTAYYKEAVEVGRIVYDKELAATCLAYVRTQGCEHAKVHQFSEEEAAGRAACAGVFTGRMGKNGPCLVALECAETAICGFDPSCTDMCCAGACRVLPATPKLGEPCTGSCEPDTYCAFDPNTGMTTVCTAAPSVGQPCPDYSCASGASCEFVDGDGPVCVARRAAGAACNFDDACEAGLVCKRDENYNNGVCYRPADEGEPCDGSSPDLVCRRYDNFCDAASERCVPLPGKGESCAQSRCRGDFFCAGDDVQLCSPVADAGEGCDYPVLCSGDNVCEWNDDFTAQTCVPPSAASPCSVPVDPLAGG